MTVRPTASTTNTSWCWPSKPSTSERPQPAKCSNCTIRDAAQSLVGHMRHKHEKSASLCVPNAFLSCHLNHLHDHREAVGRENRNLLLNNLLKNLRCDRRRTPPQARMNAFLRHQQSHTRSLPQLENGNTDEQQHKELEHKDRLNNLHHNLRHGHAHAMGASSSSALLLLFLFLLFPEEDEEEPGATPIQRRHAVSGAGVHGEPSRTLRLITSTFSSSSGFCCASSIAFFAAVGTTSPRGMERPACPACRHHPGTAARRAPLQPRNRPWLLAPAARAPADPSLSVYLALSCLGLVNVSAPGICPSHLPSSSHSVASEGTSIKFGVASRPAACHVPRRSTHARRSKVSNVSE